MLWRFVFFHGMHSGRNEAKYQGEHDGDDEVRQSDGEAQQQQACPARRTNGGDKPNSRRRGNSSYAIPIHENETGADKTDAGDDLRRDSGRIYNDCALRQNVAEPVLGDKHKECGGGADDGVSA